MHVGDLIFYFLTCARLNARIGRLGVSPSPSTKPKDTANIPEPGTENCDNVEEEGNDQQYSRIQDMIDSLIKDADSALNSQPVVDEEPELSAATFEASSAPSTRTSNRYKFDSRRERTRNSRMGYRNHIADYDDNNGSLEADNESDTASSSSPIHHRYRHLHRSRRVPDTIDNIHELAQFDYIPVYEPFAIPASTHEGTYQFPSLPTEQVGSAVYVSHEDDTRQPPFIHRMRSSITRAVLRSASFVDETVNQDIAMHESTHKQQTLSRKARSRTTTGCESPIQTFNMRSDGSYELVVDSTEDNRMSGSSSADPSSPQMWSRRRFSSINSSNIRRPDSIEEYESGSENGRKRISMSMDLELKPMQSLTVNKDEVVSPGGITSMVGLIYWTLLFTLGALMLDSFLCQVAGKRVMGTVDRIAQAEDDNGNDNDDKVKRRRKRISTGASEDSVTNTVGRFVRWYVEEPAGNGILSPPGGKRKPFKDIN